MTSFEYCLSLLSFRSCVNVIGDPFSPSPPPLGLVFFLSNLSDYIKPLPVCGQCTSRFCCCIRPVMRTVPSSSYNSGTYMTLTLKFIICRRGVQKTWMTRIKVSNVRGQDSKRVPVCLEKSERSERYCRVVCFPSLYFPEFLHFSTFLSIKFWKMGLRNRNTGG